MAISESDIKKKRAPITGIKPQILPVVSQRSIDVLNVAEIMRKYRVPAFRIKSGTSGPDEHHDVQGKGK